MGKQTGSEVDEDVEQENGVGADVEDDPARTEVVVEERYSDWENDEIRHEQRQHANIPVESAAHHPSLTDKQIHNVW